MRIYCDFDGTIARSDTTDDILSAFAAPSWRAIEADWVAGRISARACMTAQVALISATNEALDAALDAIGIDPSFAAFAAWAARENIELIIVSDGVDYFIRRILARHGLGDIPVFANKLSGDASHRILLQPHGAAGCESGVCKCAIVKSRDSKLIVYVGDGRSDFCVSAQADLLFAKDALLAHARTNGIEHVPFETFHDVAAVLRARLAALRTAAVASK